MAADAHAPTASEYIVHHLQHLQNIQQTAIVDFSVVNIDSVVIGLLVGLIGLFVLWLGARNATAGVPSRFQAAVEMLIEMVDMQTKANIKNATSRKFIGPMALTVFVWIFMMNAMDLLPVDLLPVIWAKVYELAGYDPHHAYMRVVPTADLSTTLGLAVSVLLISFYYSFKIKGAGGWAHELVSAPFGTSKNPIFALILGVINMLVSWCSC
jgi:F-type H+-transporting ATPase subunit a